MALVPRPWPSWNATAESGEAALAVGLTAVVAGGADNGYNGEYAGFTILTRENLGTAIVQGWEVSYQQQFTFLPGVLKGLGLLVNYTVIQTHGDFGGREVVHGTLNAIRYAVDEKGGVFCIRFALKNPSARRAGVRVRGGEKKFARIEVLEPRRDLGAHGVDADRLRGVLVLHPAPYPRDSRECLHRDDLRRLADPEERLEGREPALGAQVLVGLTADAPVMATTSGS